MDQLLRDMHEDEQSSAEHGESPASGFAQPTQLGLVETEPFNRADTPGDERSVQSVQRSRPDSYIIDAGTLVYHYEVIRPLGRGGQSQVYLARDTRLGRVVALKFLLITSHHRVDRFMAEARVTAQFTHENVVTLHEIGTFRDHPYMVLEYVEGRTLREWLDERIMRLEEQRKHASASLGTSADRDASRVNRITGVSPLLAAKLMRPVAQALVHSHEKGIVHRDLKPANIMLADTGIVKVLDFGIAKLLDTADNPRDHLAEGAGRADSSLTHTGDLIGTLMYMSPEQWGADAVDARTDLWAVGLILYELLCGQHPLHPLSKDKLLAVGDITVPMPRLSELRPELGALGSLIDRCLVKDKAVRIGSARELGDALERAVRPRWPRWAAGGAVLIVLAGVIGLVMTARSAAPIGFCDAAGAGAWRTSEMPQPLAAHLDSLQTGWNDLRDRTCEVERSELSDPGFERRTRCLTAYRSQVSALVDGLGGAPRGAVLHNDAAIYRLPEPDVCRDGSLGFAPLPQPDDSAQRDEIAAMRAQLTGGYDRLARGEPDDVAATARAVLSRALELGWEPLQAEAHYLIGFVSVFALQQDAAQRALDAAIALSEKADHREILARARVMSLNNHALANPMDNERFRQLANAARISIARYGWDDGLHALTMAFESTSKLLEGPDKLDLLEAAHARFRRVRMRLHAAAISVWLAVGLDARGDRKQASRLANEALDTMLSASEIPYELTCSLRWWDRLDAIVDRRNDTRAVVHRSGSVCPKRIRESLLPDGPRPEQARHISGQVVDGTARGVPGAKVILGSAIIGDGERVPSPQLLPIGQKKFAITDGDGRFSFTDARPSSLLLVAESDRGRSFPVVVARSGERPDLTLTLRRFGSVRAHFAGGDRFDQRTLVLSLFPQGSNPGGRVRLAVTRQGTDQPFVFRRVAAGHYAATLVQMSSSKSIHVELAMLAMVRDVFIEPDALRELSFAPTAVGDIAVNVIMRSEFYGDLTMGVIYAIPGAHTPRSAAEMGLLWFESGAGARLANPHSTKDAEPPPPEQAGKGDLFYRFTEITPGEYTICAAPLSERDGKLAPVLYPIEGFPPALNAYCEIATIRDDAIEQTVIIEVEPVRK
ncbi:MAG: protein kinase [Proteobacteria bacterium]|nr:protein kinase [Pseudomonadota bacterium]